MKIDASRSLFLHLAFGGPILARPFGKWLAEVPLENEEESHEMFVLEPMNLDGEWDFFYSSPWQTDTITISSHDFAMEVSGYFACDPEGPRLVAAIEASITSQMRLENEERDVRAKIPNFQNLIEAAKSLGAEDLAAPHQAQLKELLLEIRTLDSKQSGLKQKIKDDTESLSAFIDTLVRSLVAPLTKGESPWALDEVNVRIAGQDWRKIHVPKAP